MINLFSVIVKNFKTLGRSKISAAAIVLTPLLIVLLAGLAFDSSSFEGIQVGVYDENGNNITESIILNIEEDLDTHEAGSSIECKEGVEKGDFQICLVFPENLSDNKLKVFADDSRMDLAYFLINEVSTMVATEASEIGEDRASSLLNTTKEVEGILIDQKEEISQIINDLEATKSSGEDISSTLSDLSSIEDDLEDLKSSIDDIETNDSVSGIKGDIDSIISSLPLESSDDADEVVGDIQKIINELEEIESILGDAIKSLQKYSGIEPREISSPVATEIKSLTPEKTNWDYLFPTFISIVVLFGSLILGSVIVMKEKKSKAYFRNFITSTSDLTFFFGIYLTCIIVLFLQIGVVFASLYFIINMSLGGIIGKLLLFIFISGTIFIFLGMFIGYLFSSEETTVLTSISIAALLIFFSNIILPSEAISGTFKNIANYNPLVITNTILRRIILFDASISSLIYETGILLGFVLTIFILAFGLKIMTKRRAGL